MKKHESMTTAEAYKQVTFSIAVSLLFALLLLGGLSGCVTSWPDSCKVQDGMRLCKCAVLKFTIDKHPTKPKPAGVVGIRCDDKALPIEAVGQAVEK